MIAKPIREEMLIFFKEKSNTTLQYAVRISSQKPGDNLIIFCSVHGNEPAGTAAAINFIKSVEQDKIKILNGSVTFILANPKAFLQDTRFIDNNLNRSFVEHLGTDYESLRVAEIRTYMAEIKPKAVLDLHSVDFDDFNILIYKNTLENKNLAHTVSNVKTEFLFEDDAIPGTTLAEAEKFGATGMCVECGNHTSKIAPEIAYHHILNFLYYFGLINLEKTNITPPVNQKSRETYIAVESIKPEEGFRFLVEDLQTFTFISKGQIYAKSNNKDYIASEDLYISMPAKIINTNDKSAGFLCRKI